MLHHEEESLLVKDVKGMKIAVLHPDLGIGGAERLIIDIAQGLSIKVSDN